MKAYAILYTMTYEDKVDEVGVVGVALTREAAVAALHELFASQLVAAVSDLWLDYEADEVADVVAREFTWLDGAAGHAPIGFSRTEDTLSSEHWGLEEAPLYTVARTR